MLDFVRPYALYVYLAVGAIALWKAYDLGGDNAAAKSDKTIADLKSELQQRDESLRSAKRTLDEINDEAARKEAAAKKAEQAAKDARTIADRAERTLQRREAQFAVELERAKRDAGCKALLDTSVRKVCGL